MGGAVDNSSLAWHNCDDKVYLHGKVALELITRRVDDLCLTYRGRIPTDKGVLHMQRMRDIVCPNGHFLRHSANRTGSGECFCRYCKRRVRYTLTELAVYVGFI